MAVGFCFGGLMSLMPVIAGELFGIRSLGILYNCFLTSAPLGSFVLSGLLAGPLYEAEVDKEAAARSAAASTPSPVTQALGHFVHTMPRTWSRNLFATFQPLREQFLPSWGGSHSQLQPDHQSWSQAAAQLNWRNVVLTGGASPAAAADADDTECHGAHCFKAVFVIMSILCAMGMLINIFIAFRTWTTYQRLLGRGHNYEQKVEEKEEQ
eukprot:TRINITY_DN2417_c0_g2_i1.p1 TRINITY_DN2417_c0_g2~~TRINITY_DN2417_c0_g2_i1.p1  ORF type:complete len:242 (-),score=62.14 TRINITY_DN2417_c0_g2_i1:246-875(-)